ncbi:MAG: ABC transporter ATP-binding protein [Selenomonas sp.]|nr:ABC transporter ATP-binding protein [Selenomonas sp.]
MMEDTVIKASHLTKIYKIFNKPADRLKESLHPFHKRYSQDFFALKDISFSVKRGETLGIIGKNGAGKSTLLKLITGVLTPSEGTLEVEGRIASLLELGAGFNPEMTGIENIYLNGTVMGRTKGEMDERLHDIVEFADIGEFIHQPVKMYSSGMFARLAFAVNAYVEPDILIVDEALSVGDAAFQAKCITRMRHMIDSGVTVLFVTHDISVVKSFCRRCIYLEHGQIKMSGLAEEVADAYLQEVREEMNQANANAVERATKRLDLQGVKLKADFKEDEDFAKKVAQFRQGNGKAKVMALDVLDSKGEPLLQARYDEPITLRIYLRFFEQATLGVGYHIRDDKNEEVVGSYTSLEIGSDISGKPGDCCVVEFKTRLPLVGGRYNISLVVSTGLDEFGNSAVFVDFVENAYIFSVEHRKPERIWDKVYLPVSCKVSYAGGEQHAEVG